MEISPYLLAAMLLCSLLCGLALGALYDVFRIFRIMTGTEHQIGGYPRADKKSGNTARHCEKIRKYPDTLPVPVFMRRVYGNTVRVTGIFNREKNGKKHCLRSVILQILLFFEDILFFLIAGCVIALLLYYTNDGQFRGMAVFGVVCGFVLYYFTVGRLVISVSRILVFVIKAVLAYMVLFAAFPSALLFKALKLVAQKIHGRLRTVRYKKRSAVFTERQIAELCKRAGNGFLDLPDTNYENGNMKNTG